MCRVLRPRWSFPFSCAAFSGAFEWIKNAIGIGYLIECGRTFGAVAPARAGMFGIAFKLLNFASDLVDVSEQAARGLAVEAGGGDQRVVGVRRVLSHARESSSVQSSHRSFGGKAAEMNTAGPLIKRLAYRFAVDSDQLFCR